jgi:hypothetical protein
MLFGEIITKICQSQSPVYQELALPDAIFLDPIKAHVHCLGFVLADSAIGDSGCSGIISLDWRGGLGMAHFDECGAQHGTVTGIVVQACKFCFCGQ